MRRSTPRVLLTILLAAPVMANAAMWNFAGGINADQERATHSLNLPGIYFGGGVVSATLDDQSGSFMLNAFAAGLTAEPSAAHIHNAPPGSEGPIAFDLGAPTVTVPGVVAYMFNTTLTHDQVNALTGNGAFTVGTMTDWYVNIHTPMNPTGEIRGQLTVTNASSGPSAVPVPAAVWLLGSALVGVTTLRRRVS